MVGGIRVGPRPRYTSTNVINTFYKFQKGILLDLFSPTSMSCSSPYSSHHSGYHGISSGFYIYVDNRSGHMSHISQFSPYYYGGLNISHPRFLQEAIPRGVHGKKFHQNHPYSCYPSMPTHPHQSMSPHSHAPTTYTIWVNVKNRTDITS